jgi:hypothetical protein
MRWLGFLILTILTLIISPLLVGVYVLGGFKIPWWMNTPDDSDITTQGLYEPQVKAVLDKYGQKVKTWYWLGIRNQMYGLFWKLSESGGPSDFRLHGTYPSPQSPGVAAITGKGYLELAAAWNYGSAKYGKFRIGWKLEPLLHETGPIAFLLQFKPYLTR